MSWLIKMSLRNRSIVGLVVVAVVIFGAIAVSYLKQELIPDLVFDGLRPKSAYGIEEVGAVPLQAETAPG